MTEQEIVKMQSLIDEGVHRAQSRLWQRAGATGQSLVVFRSGRIQTVVPDAAGTADMCSGDPLARRKKI